MQDYDEQFPLAAYALSQTEFVNWNDLTHPYTRTVQVWHCPSSEVGKEDQGGKVTTHFGFNALYLTDIAPDFSNANEHETLALADVKQPTETLMLADAKSSIEDIWCGDDGRYLLPPSGQNAHCWGRPNDLHNKGSNIFWVDGHVKWMKKESFYAGQTPEDRYFDLE